MSTLEIVVALLRGVHMAALVSLFGTLVFLTLVAPSARTFASDICAASSINRTSTDAAASGRAQNQAVAAATWHVVPIAASRAGLSFVKRSRG